MDAPHPATDLSDLVPAYDPAEDTLATVGGMALDAIPLLGPLAGRVLDHALATNERKRRHDFDKAIVGELQRLAERADETLTVADVVHSDEFLASLARARREAAETASTTKRQRLARAAVSALNPSAPSLAEREGYRRLIVELDDLHIWLLSYFANPRAWLDTHGLSEVHSSHLDSVERVLRRALSHFDIPYSAPVTSALADLHRLRLADVPLTSMMTSGGSVQPRISARGRAFLAYLDEGNAAEADPRVAWT